MPTKRGNNYDEREKGSEEGIMRRRFEFITPFLFMFFLILVHELGHILMYMLLLPEGDISLYWNLSGFHSQIIVQDVASITPSVLRLCKAGPLLLTIPFLLLWKRLPLLERVVLVIYLMFAFLEVVA